MLQAHPLLPWEMRWLKDDSQRTGEASAQEGVPTCRCFRHTSLWYVSLLAFAAAGIHPLVLRTKLSAPSMTSLFSEHLPGHLLRGFFTQ